MSPTDSAKPPSWQAERLAERLLAFADPRLVHLFPLRDGTMAIQCKPWRRSGRGRRFLRLYAERIAESLGGGHVDNIDCHGCHVAIIRRRAPDSSVLKLAEAIGRRLAEQAFAKLYGDKP